MLSPYQAALYPDGSSSVRDSHSATRRLREQLEDLLESLLRFSRSRAPDGEFALDVAQEAVAAALSASRNGRSWENTDALWMWLIGVVRNKTADEYRARHRRMPSVSVLGAVADELKQPVCDGDMPDELMVRDEVQQVCRLALDELPPRQRDALFRFHWAGESYRTIGAQMGISPKAAESLLGRARKELHRVLARIVEDPEGLL